MEINSTFLSHTGQEEHVKKTEEVLDFEVESYNHKVLDHLSLKIS